MPDGVASRFSVEIVPRKAKAPRYPIAIEYKYQRIILKLILEFRQIAIEEVKRSAEIIIQESDKSFLRSDMRLDAPSASGWAGLLNDMLERIALAITSGILLALNKIEEISANTSDFHSRDFRRQAREAYGMRTLLPGRENGNINGLQRTGIIKDNPLAINILNNEPNLPPILSAWEQQNIALIKTVPANLTEKLRAKFTDAFVNGTNMKDLANIVVEETGATQKRAKVIARDQIGKLNGQLSQMRQKAAGIDEYVWRTVGDERVRPTHRTRNNKKYSWSNKEEIKPGQEIMCRCAADPVFPTFKESLPEFPE